MLYPIFQSKGEHKDFEAEQWYVYENGGVLVGTNGTNLLISLSGIDSTVELHENDVFSDIDEAQKECEGRNVIKKVRIIQQNPVWICTALCMTSPQRSFIVSVKSDVVEAIKFCNETMESVHFEDEKWMWNVARWEVDGRINCPVDQHNILMGTQLDGLPFESSRNYPED